MKKTAALTGLILSVLIFVPLVSAETSTGYRGQAMNGSTGLFSIPSGRLGWDGDGVAMDFSYRAITIDDGTAHLTSATISLFNWVEISTALDIQPPKNGNDFLVGVKVRLPIAATVAVGSNFQLIDYNSDQDWTVFQPYIAITYPGNLFNMRAETTLVFGKTFISEVKNDSSIDFGMGFDLILFPDVFGEMVHWIIDFANFHYSADAWGGNPWLRGILNTGFRIDMSTMAAFSDYKFLIDVIFNDLFDDDQRAFSIGATFGLRL